MPQHSTKTNFRTDVNGLRAWAVVAVVLFHFGVPGFAGGFAGVDVFFVISGFLMMGIIVRGLESTRGKPFSVMHFYLARAKRIVPALLVLCIVLLILGWFFLSAKDYELLGKQVNSALGFYSNVKFWKETGYFAQNSHEIWLLHTWSLSVEWQFYLILPLAMMLLWKLKPGRKPLIIAVSATTIASFALSLWLMPAKQGTAFFLLPPRAWEMLTGALVYLAGNRFHQSGHQRKILEWLGLILIVVSIVAFNSKLGWPGWRVLLPVAGASLVLLAARQNSIWTGTKLAQWLGNCSYSLYLWHWPVLVALVYLGKQKDPVAIATGLGLTVVLGQLSYVAIENGSKTWFRTLDTKRIATVLGMTALITATLCTLIIMRGGLSWRLPPRANTIFMAANDKNPRMVECLVSDTSPVPGCTYGGKKLGIIVLGDSHAASIMRTVEKALPSTELHVLDWSLTGCVTAIGVRSASNKNYRCTEFLNWAISEQKKFSKTVPLLIMNRSSEYAAGPNEPYRSDEIETPDTYFSKPYASRTPEFYQELREHIIDTACAFARYRPVYLIRPTPEMNVNVPAAMGRDVLIAAQGDVSISMDEYRRRHTLIWSAQDAAKEKCDVKILDPLPYFCHDERCYGARDGLPVFYDSNHLNEHGASYLKPMFMDIFKQEKIQTHRSTTIAVPAAESAPFE